MPYNLRKRKAPEEVIEAPAKEPVKASRGRAKKAKVAEPKPKVEEEQLVDETAQIEPETKQSKGKKSKVEKPKVETKKRKVASKKIKADDEQPQDDGQATKVEPDEPDTKEEAPEEVDEEPKVVEEELKTTDKKRCIYMYGEDAFGVFGLGKIEVTKKKPVAFPVDHDIKQVVCGPMHMIALTTTGEVYSCGCNDEGALGRITDSEEQEATPTKVHLDAKIVKVSAGDNHSAALSEDHQVFVWGNFKDEHGSIGLQPECNGEKTCKPIQVIIDCEIKDIASGSNHMLLLDTKGNVYSFGVGSQGQLGRLSAEQLGPSETETHAITAENRELYLKPQKIDFSNVDPQRTFICDAIYAGNYSSFATNTDKKKNRLAGWGLNNYFQLGYKGSKQKLKQCVPRRSTFTCSTNIINVACGQHHTLFLTKTGRVYAAGNSLYGILGLGKVSGDSVCPAKNIDSLGNSVTTIQADSRVSFAVTDDGKLYSWGMGGPCLGSEKEEEDLLHPTEVERLKGKKVISISSGMSFTAVVAEV